MQYMTFIAFLLTRFTRPRLVNWNCVEEITRLRKRTSLQRFRWHAILWNVISYNGVSMHVTRSHAPEASAMRAHQPRAYLKRRFSIPAVARGAARREWAPSACRCQ